MDLLLHSFIRSGCPGQTPCCVGVSACGSFHNPKMTVLAEAFQANSYPECIIPPYNGRLSAIPGLEPNGVDCTK